MKTVKILFTTLSLIPLVMSSFSQENQKMNMAMGTDGSVQKAVCVLYPTMGNNASGTIAFIKMNDGIKVVVDMQGLTRGLHGFHVHEYGDCSSADGSSAGGHFNPGMKSHGGPSEMNRHAGDMGNFEADDKGMAHYEYADHTMALEGPQSIIGRAVVVHKNADDMKSQPAGNSGPRIACGVIGIGK